MFQHQHKTQNSSPSSVQHSPSSSHRSIPCSHRLHTTTTFIASCTSSAVVNSSKLSNSVKYSRSSSSQPVCFHRQHHHSIIAARLRTPSTCISQSSFTPKVNFQYSQSTSNRRKQRSSNHQWIISASVAKGNAEDPSSSSSSSSSSTNESEGDNENENENNNEEDDDEIKPGRPDWAPKWFPNFLLNIRDKPWLQLCILLPLYAIHLFLFSTKGYKFKKSIIPNPKNLFQSIGYDSIAGSVVTVIFLIWRRWMIKKNSLTTEDDNNSNSNQKENLKLSNLLKVDDPPWKVPREAKRKIGQTTLLLFVAYLASGYGAVFSEQILYLLAGSGVPLTVATTRAWKVLLGHLMWVYMGINILRRLNPFFPKKGTWLKWKWKNNWLWWAIGGYYISALFFNIADVVNQLILPSSLFEEETVVSKLINPENKDRMAMAVGSIGPCVSAPVFEEVLYRGFLLPALACFLPMWAAIPMSSVLFAIHHLNPTMIIPLSMLGFVWAILYARSGNLVVTILIHAMWNSRVFLGSLLGLGPFTDFE